MRNFLHLTMRHTGTHTMWEIFNSGGYTKTAHENLKNGHGSVYCHRHTGEPPARLNAVWTVNKLLSRDTPIMMNFRDPATMAQSWHRRGIPLVLTRRANERQVVAQYTWASVWHDHMRVYNEYRDRVSAVSLDVPHMRDEQLARFAARVEFDPPQWDWTNRQNSGGKHARGERHGCPGLANEWVWDNFAAELETLGYING